MERTPGKSQHTKLTLEKKILPPLPPTFELATIRSRVRRLYQQAIAAVLLFIVTETHVDSDEQEETGCGTGPSETGPLIVHVFFQSEIRSET